jgi:hypothetical protein
MKYVEVLSKVAPIFSTLIAFIAAIFISKQIANIRRNREVDTLMKIIALADGDRMRDARDWLIYELHNYSSAQELKADKEAMKKFSHIVHLFNTMGVLVNNRYIPERLVFDKYGLLLVGAWHRLENLISSMRVDSQSPEYAEHFELLVSKYDGWTKKHPLSTAKGKRMTLSEAKSYLDYGGQSDEGVHKRDSTSLGK